MTTQAQTKHSAHKGVHKKSIFGEKVNAPYAEEAKLIAIATGMLKSGLIDSFVVNALQTAFSYEGVADLMHLWASEKNQKERDEIVADIQDMIDACNQKEKSEEMYIRFNDLEEISKNIRAFKDSLYQIVNKHGGISKLAELTGIPQPSLSRFFNSDSMPRRATVLTIAKALNLDGIEIDMRWTK